LVFTVTPSLHVVTVLHTLRKMYCGKVGCLEFLLSRPVYRCKIIENLANCYNYTPNFIDRKRSTFANQTSACDEWRL
jgi:hypothetical protein